MQEQDVPVEIVILTVIPIELQAARRVLGIDPGRGTKDASGTVYYRGVVRSERTHRSYAIVLTCIGTAGNPAAAAATAKAIEKYHPRAVVLMGIAAGFRGKVKIGEVVLSERVVAYEPAALIESSQGMKEQPRPEMDRVPHTIFQDLASYGRPEPARLDDAFRRAGGVVPTATAGREADFEADVASGISAHQGTIASGEKLLRDPEKLRQLRELHGKIEAGEMEAAGVVDGCRPGAVPWLIIRGISDFGDQLKDDRFHTFASCAAAAVLYDFIAHGLDLGTSPPPATRHPTPAGHPPVGRHLLGFGQAVDPAEDISGRYDEQPRQPSTGDSGQTDQLQREVAGQTATSEDLVGDFWRASSALLAWPQTLRATGEWVDRPELQKLIAHMLEKKGALVLLGAPGSGKSALLARTSGELHAKGAAVLAIKADRLPREIDSREKLAKELGLPAGLDLAGALRESAAVRPTILVIDQLDALSDLLDEQTQRLTLLLELVEELAHDPAVAIAMSCRTFDFSHDVRFRRLAADQLPLQPPSTAELDRILKAAGIDSAKLPSQLKAVLGTVQALDTFLQLGPPEKLGLMETHQQLLNLLWRQRMGETSEAKVLEAAARKLAMMMADREELWLTWPVIEEEGLESPISILIERGLLGKEDQRVAFAHQTLFEFARARAFLSNSSLAEYVRRKQGALFVRPTMWTTLAYLRSIDPQRYITELEKLWSDPAVRMHIHTLLVEFVGQVADPRDREIALLVSQLSDDVWRPVSINAVMGRPVWFAILHEVHFPALMRGSHAAMMTSTLIRALDFSPEPALDLIEKYWASDETKHQLIAIVLTYAKVWSERLRDLALTVMRTDTLDRSAIHAMLGTAVEVDPTFAPKLIVEKLARWRDAIADPNFRAAYEDLLTNCGGLDCIVDAAAAAPREFFAELWSWVVDMIERVRYPGTSVRYGEDRCHGLSLRHGGGGDLARALRTSIVAWAVKDPNGVALLVSAWQDRDSVALHRFLIMSLEAGLPSTHATALTYLLGDERRFNVGDSSPMDRYSARLVQKLAPLLAEAEMEQLRLAIASTRLIDPRDSNPDDQSLIATCNLQHQLRLLRALGKEHLPDETRAAIEKFEQEDSDGNEGGVRASLFESPLSSVELLRMSDDEILRAFAEMPDDVEGRYPGSDLVWSGIELSREFAKAAKQEPERFLALLSHFVPGVTGSPVGMALTTLAEVIPLHRIEDVVVALHERGFFCTQEQQRHVAYALEVAAHNKAEIRERVLTLLESWLVDVQGEDRGELQASVQKASNPHSLLWTRDGGGLPGGNYPILHTLTLGYLERVEPWMDPWLGVLERHLERREHSDVWLAMSFYLGNVLHAPKERAERFLDRLFARFPSVREAHDGLVIIACAMHRMPGETITRWLEDVEKGTWEQRHQAFGELLVLFASRRDAPSWTHERLEHELTRFETSRSDPTGIVVGIAFAVAHLWTRPERRTAVTEILVRVIRAASGTVAEAVMDAFRNQRALLNDEETRRVLPALTSAPAVVTSGRGLSYLDDLQHLLPASAAEIAELLIALASHLETQADRSYLMSHGSELVDLAMTLQRLGSPIRERGLDLFERLLAIRVYETYEVLAELDPAERTSPLRAPRAGRPRHSRRAARPA